MNGTYMPSIISAAGPLAPIQALRGITFHGTGTGALSSAYKHRALRGTRTPLRYNGGTPDIPFRWHRGDNNARNSRDRTQGDNAMRRLNVSGGTRLLPNAAPLRLSGYWAWATGTTNAGGYQTQVPLNAGRMTRQTATILSSSRITTFTAITLKPLLYLKSRGPPTFVINVFVQRYACSQAKSPQHRYSCIAP